MNAAVMSSWQGHFSGKSSCVPVVMRMRAPWFLHAHYLEFISTGFLHSPACEMHAYEVYTYEIHAYEICTYEMHA